MITKCENGFSRQVGGSFIIENSGDITCRLTFNLLRPCESVSMFQRTKRYFELEKNFQGSKNKVSHVNDHCIKTYHAFSSHFLNFV